MAAKLELTSLAIAALGLLAERSMHPYEMYQLLIARRQDRLVKVRPGTLYHTVGRLAHANLVEAVGTQREGNRPERTNYAILPAGRQALQGGIEELLASANNEFPKFPQAISEAHNLPGHVVVELLGQRIAGLVERLAELESDAQLATSGSVEQMFWIEVLYQQTLIRAEVDWLRRLCADITSGELPWPDLGYAPKSTP